MLNMAGLPVMQSDTHIVPVLVRDARNCKAASDLLLHRYGIYIQPINYPTVPRGSERLRITPTPYHDDALVEALCEALIDVWQTLGLPLKQRADVVTTPGPIARRLVRHGRSGEPDCGDLSTNYGNVAAMLPPSRRSRLSR